MNLEKILPYYRRRRAVVIKRRRAKRFAFPYTLYFGPLRPPPHKSFIKDLSDKGIGVKTNVAFSPGTKLHLIIETADKIYRADGVVAWSNQTTPGLVQLLKTGMGIKFSHVDQGLIDLYEEKFRDELVANGYVDIS
jgi:Tfp pilus assembly protein PilZ